ncbi:hypothetical protein MBLNU457_6313t1 [Dothideomycetes sp. NU457]
MSTGPTHVRIKRRRDETPLPSLRLEGPQQELRKFHHLEYRLETHLHTPESTKQNATPQDAPPTAPRRFELSTPSRKRNAETAGLMPTFVEKKRRGPSSLENTTRAELHDISDEVSTPLKRPGTKTLRQDQSKNVTPSKLTPAPSLELADAMHQFALEEVAQEEAEHKRVAAKRTVEKPRVIIQPKGSVRRLKDRQPQSASLISLTSVTGINNSIDEMSDDEDYVYDIYVKHADILMTEDTTDPVTHSIGILVITEEDEEIWESYIEGEEEEKFDTDDEDENAEDYYGADYPEDEVASDDEYNQGAYGYRHGGSDDEQWDSETGTYSDEEDAMKNPWKKAPWLRATKDEDDEDDEY